MEARVVSLKPLRKSLPATPHWGLASTRARRVWTRTSHPPGVPTPSCRGTLVVFVGSVHESAASRRALAAWAWAASWAALERGPMEGEGVLARRGLAGVFHKNIWSRSTCFLLSGPSLKSSLLLL